MSKVFNMVGGGGKNISSIVITGLKSTDTITCTKDGKSYTATWDSTAQYWEIVGLPLGTFTVTATNGTKNKTETVLIDIAGVYKVEMSFELWLYKDGNPYSDITGGWQCWVASPGGTSELLDTSIHIASSANNQAQETSTKVKIDLANFSNVKAEVQIAAQMMAQFCELGLRICNDVNTSTSTDPYLVRKEVATDIGTHIITVDISDLNGEYYIVLEGYYVGSAYIYKVWLE